MQRVIAVFAETVVDVFGPNGQHQLTWSQDQIEDVTFTVLRIVINLSTVIHLGEGEVLSVDDSQPRWAGLRGVTFTLHR